MENDRKWWRRLVRLDTALLLVALIAGVAGAVLSAQYLSSTASATEASLRNRYETRPVVVAAADLAAGESLDSTRLAVRQVPKEFLPDDAVTAERASVLIGGRTAIAIQRGTPVVTAALRENRDPRRLASILNGETRALTIAVDQVNSQAGNLLPGDWIDLYYSRSTDSDAMLVPLLQRVEILATGVSVLGEPGNSQFTEADGGFSTITLGLSADDAARVVLAQQSGSVSVVLRAPGDVTPISMEPRSSRDLLRPARKPRTAPDDARIEVLVGGKGELLPERSWMGVGQARPVAGGDAS
jgi:pilus assembly protein CpaB